MFLNKMKYFTFFWSNWKTDGLFGDIKSALQENAVSNRSLTPGNIAL